MNKINALRLSLNDLSVIGNSHCDSAIGFDLFRGLGVGIEQLVMASAFDG
jgi:hypothetical protein